MRRIGRKKGTEIKEKTNQTTDSVVRREEGAVQDMMSLGNDEVAAPGDEIKEQH